MTTLRTSLALPVLATLCWSWLPQDPERAAALPAAEKQDPVVRVKAQQTGFVLKEGEIAVEALVAKAADFLDVNILIEPMALSTTNPAPITLSRAIEVDVNGCWDLVSQLLFTRGLVLTVIDERLGVWEVLSLTGQRRMDVMGRAQFVDAERLPAYAKRMVPILTTVALENINATVATNALRPFFASYQNNASMNLQIGNVGDQTSLILTGFGAHVHEAWQLLQKVDKPPMNPSRFEARMQALEARLAALEKAAERAK